MDEITHQLSYKNMDINVEVMRPLTTAAKASGLTPLSVKLLEQTHK